MTADIIWSQGFNAYHDHLDIRDNPYDYPSNQWTYWKNGYNAAEKEDRK